METPGTYIPMDRRQAIATGSGLPDQTRGAALFADISGFTPLTEILLKAYGPKRGAEELTRELYCIYDGLVTEVHRYGGSVLAFSGDAITCWFDSDDGLQATACGLSMQRVMGQYVPVQTPAGDAVPLAMKVAVATGPVRRFQLGDPQIQYIDALAGATLERMAEAEHHAEKGEVLVGQDVVAQIGDKIKIAEWRQDAGTNERFGVVTGLLDQTQTMATIWPDLAAEALTEEKTRLWVLPPIYDRLRMDQGRFLAELRPVAVLFLYFSGIDYDQDEDAGHKLDAYIRWVQKILVRYEAYVFQLTIGDKGSYLYTAFGAPIAHEDDAVRAVSAALELRTLPAELSFINQVKIGVSQGQVYTGAYGGRMRRTYGVLGDEVNLAARLMQAAKSGQILIKDTVWQSTDGAFTGESLPPLKVKGKSEPVVAFSVSGLQTQRAIHLQEPNYTLPMVGREAELALIEQKMSQAMAGHGQIVAIIAEAGMGKSRLVAEVIRLGLEKQALGYGGECQSYGTNISYLVWQPIWQAFFNLDPAWPVADQLKELESRLEHIDSSLVPRLPLLGAVLNLSIPDNDLTRSFDAKLRKTSLESLLVDCLRAQARKTPILLVLEDGHWLDPLSHDLLEVIGRAIVDLPVLLVSAYRPLQLERLKEARLEKLPYFTEVYLTDFTPEEAERLINLKLAQFFGDQADLPPAVIERITARAQGNPFYIEELINYLQHQNLDLHNPQLLEQLDLPASLHSLILSRIDQLSESQKSTVKVASVIGRLFEAGWLWGMYPELGDVEQVKTDLEALNRLDLAPLDKPEPELTYIFKHIVTQEVAYESLPYAMRATLHDQLAQFIERRYSDKLDRYLNLLAFHYDRSENKDKKKEYLRRAGEAAQLEYANQAAIDYYQRVLPLLPSSEQVTIRRKLGDVLHLVGQWQEAGQMYEQALTLAEQLGDRPARAWCQIALGELFRKQGLYPEASEWLEKAQSTFEALNDQAGVGEALHLEGTLAAQQGDLDTAQARWNKSLTIRRELQDKPRIAALLSNLGIVAHYQGDQKTAHALHEEALTLRYEIGDKSAIANSLNNLGNLYLDEDDYLAAQTQLEVALGLQREIGDRWAIANALNNLANVTRAQGDYETARTMYKESLTTNWELGDRWAITYLLEDIGGLAALQGQAERALRLTGAAATLRETINAPLPPAEQEKLTRILAPARQALGQTAAAAEAAGKALSLEQAIEEALHH